MSFKEQFISYLKYYSEKDIVKISEMFADNITLRDWKISVSSKETAIKETQKNFSSDRCIEIEILQTYESSHAVTGELRIVVNKTEVLYVVDVVTFDLKGKIKSIRAYLGRED